MSKKPISLPKLPAVSARAAKHVCEAMAQVPGRGFQWATRAMFEWRDASSPGYDPKNGRSLSERAAGKAWQDAWQAAAIGWASR